MASIEITPRYRNFSSNMPLPKNPTPRARSSLITVEKEPERDPEEDCFMCRQAHVYVKPIGMQQERRVARHYPPPLSRAQIDELSRKKQLTKQEARKLLQCYFPEIKNVKYFQLHKYHSCCYDPKHLNLCKNHITALQRQRDQHPNHHDHQNGDENNENHYKEYERESAGKPNRVSFVRIKIEPTKGIPTRFLGPTALPESLADMLIKQVNRFEDKKTKPSFNSNQISQPYRVRRVNNPYATDDDDDEDGEDDDEDEDEYDDEEEDDNDENNKKGNSANGDMVVEDLDELDDLNGNRRGTTRSSDNQQTFPKGSTRKNQKKKKTRHGHRKPKLKHWELMALEQAKQEPCNCRHHVLRLEADKVVYDWCRCKDHQHKAIVERHKPTVHTLPSTTEESTPLTPPPPPTKEATPLPPLPPPQPKPRKVRKKSIGINATESDTNTTQIALAYDPSAVDYDMIQELVYYRTSSGRLIKPEVTNAFTYDTIPQGLTSMTINPNDPVPNKAEVLYMTPGGQLQPYETGRHRRRKINDHSTTGKSTFVTYPGSLYDGQAHINTENAKLHTRGSTTMPIVKLPTSIPSSGQNSSNTYNKGYQPPQFTLATFSPDKNLTSPTSRGSIVSDSQRSLTSGSQERGRNVVRSMQKSTKPTYSNLEPTPDYGRQSSVVANRRWFDQPLGDQNLRPVHDGQYGLIAGTSTGQYAAKSQLHENDPTEANMPKNEGNCTVS